MENGWEVWKESGSEQKKPVKSGRMHGKYE